MKSIYVAEDPVLTLSSIKTAAVYFDKFEPCFCFDDEGRVTKVNEDGTLQYADPQTAIEDFLGVQKLKLQPLVHQFRIACSPIGVGAVNIIRNDELDRIEVSLEEMIQRSGLSRCGHSGIALYTEDEKCSVHGQATALASLVRNIYGEDQYDIFGWDSVRRSSETVDMTLSKIRLVNTENISWDAISELRADNESVKQLRALRRFIVSNMQGYSLSHIEDELEAAIEKHEIASKKWSLTTAPAELSIDIEASLAVGFLTAFGAIASGAELTTASAIGALAPLGQALISINRGRKKIIKNSNVGYLMRLKGSQID